MEPFFLFSSFSNLVSRLIESGRTTKERALARSTARSKLFHIYIYILGRLVAKRDDTLARVDGGRGGDKKTVLRPVERGVNARRGRNAAACAIMRAGNYVIRS